MLLNILDVHDKASIIYTCKSDDVSNRPGLAGAVVYKQIGHYSINSFIQS